MERGKWNEYLKDKSYARSELRFIYFLLNPDNPATSKAKSSRCFKETIGIILLTFTVLLSIN
ncbi:MAG: hypothetical protein PHV06_02280 [bacterium]|nr:hypothetical protein [bacterium]